MRGLLADGFNSACHIILGALAFHFWMLVPIFILYQMLHPYDINLRIDICEFICGYCVATVLL